MVQRLKETHTGRVVTEETKQKMSDSHKGNVPTQATRDAVSLAASRPVEIEGIMHPSLRGAGKALGVSELTIRNRINSSNPKFSNYSFKEKS